jgi:hypothetical protein
MMHKIEGAISTWGNLGVYHLDELYNCNRSAFFKLLCCCLSINQSTSLTLFIFLSAQFLINHHNVLNIFVTCVQEHTLCLIAMDEARIHIQHGTSFCDDIRALCMDFFRWVFGNQPVNQHLRLIVLSATFPTSYIRILSSFSTVDFTTAIAFLGDC